MTLQYGFLFAFPIFRVFIYIREASLLLRVVLQTYRYKYRIWLPL